MTALRLTRRQREVVQGISEGLKCKAIAKRLGVKERTVRQHIENINAKLDKMLPSGTGRLTPIARIIVNVDKLLEAAA